MACHANREDLRPKGPETDKTLKSESTDGATLIFKGISQVSIDDAKEQSERRFFAVCSFCFVLFLISLLIFRIILPGLVMSTVLTVVMHNYYKVLGLSASFFKKSIIALIVAFLANLVAFLIFKSRESISIASIFAPRNKNSQPYFDF